MKKSAIVDTVIFDGSGYVKDHAVLLEDDLIVDVCPTSRLPGNIHRTISIDGRLLAPGFMDLQVNGGGGALFSNEPTVSTLRKMSAAHRRYGTVAFFPTVISTDDATMCSAVDAVRSAIGERVPGVMGIHFEGPHLSTAKAGVHNARHFRQMDERGLRVIESLGMGKTIVTLAPECVLPGQISRLANQDIVVCAGHSAASYDAAIRAVSAGVAGFTHLFNAMSSMAAREPGMAGAALASANTWFGVIADGLHVHPAVFASAVRAKERGGAVLVTDAMSTVGTTQDWFELNGERIKVRNGRCVNSKGELAGSTLTMNQAVRNAAKFAEIEIAEALRMASLYPARAVGLDIRVGHIRPGHAANLIDLDEGLTVHGTWCAGNYEPASNGVSKLVTRPLFK